ncbi:Crp/Fnr family transcriptional regulator [Sphaerisporangium dianthi]|uniref:Crp/Fnr family transcriptional regulator n=1 Tax=Sphaerisporangium dianthi TaxID=1436120 RepID=A0ABV9CVS2_9ACTN
MLTRQEQTTLRTRSAASRHDKGTVIVAEGAATRQVTIIRSGWAKATVIKADRPVLLRLYGPGELIGISTALTGTAPAETVTVTCYELHAMSLPARSFADFLRRAPNASTALHRLQQWRLEEADRLRTIRDYPTAAQRLAGLLIELCRPENDPIYHDDGSISVPTSEASLSQQDLGTWIGDSRKTVVRALSDLHEMGVTRSLLPRHVNIIAPGRLRAFAEAADAGRPTSY